MKVFVVVGMPASGKNIARIYAEKKDIPYFATGDLVREEVRRLGLEPDAANTGRISTQLRGADGLGVTRLALKAALQSGSDQVFMEGMRSWPEIELIREKAGCVVIAFIAPRQVRLERIVSRARADDAADAFAERDGREIAYGAATPIALADEYILNARSLRAALNSIERIILKYRTPMTVREYSSP